MVRKQQRKEDGRTMAMTSYNGVPIPGFMYGTAWKKEATTRLVLEAVKAGFTAIDTANQLIHYDETLVGEALLRLREEGVAREGLFLQSKFTPPNGQDHRTPYDVTASITTQVRQSFESSLAHLHTDYLDSYVLHGPYHRGGLGPEDWEVWAAIESLYVAGRTKLIGVSNVSAGQLALLCDRAAHRPMIVQNRCYGLRGTKPCAICVALTALCTRAFRCSPPTGKSLSTPPFGHGRNIRHWRGPSSVPVRHADRHGPVDGHHECAAHGGRSAGRSVHAHAGRDGTHRDDRHLTLRRVGPCNTYNSGARALR